jgi:hypothetical protein
VDPTKRYGVIHGGASTIKAHPWFKGFSFDDLLNRRIKVYCYTQATMTASRLHDAAAVADH